MVDKIELFQYAIRLYPCKGQYKSIKYLTFFLGLLKFSSVITGQYLEVIKSKRGFTFHNTFQYRDRVLRIPSVETGEVKVIGSTAVHHIPRGGESVSSHNKEYVSRRDWHLRYWRI